MFAVPGVTEAVFGILLLQLATPMPTATATAMSPPVVTSGYHYALSHAVSSLAFGDHMVRLMLRRVSDPTTRLVSVWHTAATCAVIAMSKAAAMAAMAADERGGEGGVTTTSSLGVFVTVAGPPVLVALSAAALMERYAHLTAQITGCLGLSPNPFVLRHRKHI